MIAHHKQLFKPLPKSIYWFYGEIEPTNKFSNVKYIKGLPDETYNLKQSMVILDDLFLEAKNNDFVTNLFSRVAHHRQTFVVFITQNLYHQSKHNRTRMLNCHYLVLFKNVRDSTIVQTLSRQMFPGNPTFLRQVFNDITTSYPYAYMFLDLRTETPDYLRIRSHIFTDYFIYKQNSNNPE